MTLWVTCACLSYPLARLSSEGTGAVSVTHPTTHYLPPITTIITSPLAACPSPQLQPQSLPTRRKEMFLALSDCVSRKLSQWIQGCPVLSSNTWAVGTLWLRHTCLVQWLHQHHGGYLLFHTWGECDAGQDVVGRHRAWHEPRVSLSYFNNSLLWGRYLISHVCCGVVLYT